MNMHVLINQESGRRIELCEAIQSNSDLFTTDTSVVLGWAFTRGAGVRTIAITTADYGLRSAEAVTM